MFMLTSTRGHESCHALQIAAETQAEAWRAAEGTLNTRIADAEARAAAAAERERHLAERNHVSSRCCRQICVLLSTNGACHWLQ